MLLSSDEEDDIDDDHDRGGKTSKARNAPQSSIKIVRAAKDFKPQ